MPDRPFLTAASALALVTTLSAAHAAPTVVYREVFPNDFIVTASGPQAAEATAQGWYGAQHGGTPFVTQNGQIAKPASGNGEPGAINSNPQGLTTDTGFLFWSPNQRAGIYLYTGEVAGLSLSTADLLSVNWDSRNSTNNLNSSTHMRLAFLVGGQWYISSVGEPHSSGSGSAATWETNTLSPLSLSYQLFDDHSGLEPITALPRNNDNLPGLQPLPSGTLEAVGLWMNFNAALPSTDPNFANATIRIDNFEITANVVPEPGSLALAGLAFAGLAGLRRVPRKD
jgi:hypothetical protein